MSRKIKFGAPVLQVDFAFILKKFRATYLQDALFETVGNMKIADIDKQLAQYVSDKDLALMAQYGLRGELLFAVPVVLGQNPYLLGYYRLLMGYSRKEFYGNDKGFGAGPFKGMETSGKIAETIVGDIPELCTAFCEAASTLLRGIETLTPSKELLGDLALLTVGPQLRGGVNNRRGTAGVVQIFEIIRRIVAHAATEIRENTIEIASAAGRKVLVEFAPDPDIIIREEMSAGHFRNIVAIEIKSGTDVSNIHNRIGEAEKSHQKARRCGYTECWTIVNVGRLDMEKAKAESPSTDRFYSLGTLVDEIAEEYEDFRRRIISLTAVAGMKQPV
jgi:hypothetical protein